MERELVKDLEADQSAVAAAAAQRESAPAAAGARPLARMLDDDGFFIDDDVDDKIVAPSAEERAQLDADKRRVAVDQATGDALVRGGAAGADADAGAAAGSSAAGEGEGKEEDEEALAKAALEAAMAEAAAQTHSPDEFADRCKYIPLRLTYKERKYLRLVEAALNVSEYTDKIDVWHFRNKSQRKHEQLRDVCAILTGLMVAHDYKRGQSLVRDRDFKHNAAFFQACFEIARRYKIMNPAKMRTDYGKLIYMLMDSCERQVQALLEFPTVRPIRTVYNFLEAKEGLAILRDELVWVATREVADDKHKTRAQIQRDIRAKNQAIDTLSRKYASAKLSEEEIKHCLYSVADNSSFLGSNRDPVDKMITHLTTHFDPRTPEPGYSLAIQAGSGGSRLSHNHARQYVYVLQSLTLWREILNDMFRLWCLAEEDLLDPACPYQLRDTGQGLNRVQPAPRIGRAMHNIIHRVQTRMGGWVGSSVVHLGDSNVPNALVFIDKYTQIYRILNPVVLVLQQLDILCRDNAGIREYVERSFGGPEKCKKDILLDFFRFAFDGSGADNFFDAGSCIDGRLTSAWNWCNRLEKKPFFPVFLLCGFSGFDGDFK